MALLTLGVVDPWLLHFKAGPLHDGAFDPIQIASCDSSFPSSW
jgi:hypothetical protein